MAALPPDFDTKKYPLANPRLILSVSDQACELPPLIQDDLSLYVENFAVSHNVTAPRTMGSTSSFPAALPATSVTTSPSVGTPMVTGSGSNSSATTKTTPGTASTPAVADSSTSSSSSAPRPATNPVGPATGAASIAYAKHSLSINTARIDLVKTAAQAEISLSAPVALAATNGSDGGDVSLYIAELSAGTLPFDLRVVGGNGHVSTDTAAATNGGNGGSLKLQYQTAYGRAWAVHDKLMTAYESKSPDVSSAVLNVANAVKTLPNASLVTHLTEMLSDFKTAYTSADSATATKIVRKIDGLLADQDNGQVVANRRRMFVNGGAYGHDVKGKANGTRGKDGTTQVLSFRTPRDQCGWDVPFAHPVQLRMLLEKAKLKYFLADKKSLTVAMDLLTQIFDRLSFVTELKPNDTLSKAYDEHAKQMVLIDGTSAIVDLKAIRQEAKRYLDQMRDGTDFYGKSLKYVPRGSYESYSGEPTEDVIWKNLQNVETLYTNYLDATKTDEQKTTAILQVAASAGQTITANTTRIKLLKEEISTCQTKIMSYKDPISHQYDALIRAEAKIEDTIQNAYRVPFSNILGALGQCLMAPSKAMVLVQAVTLGNSAANTLTSDQADDKKINKDYLIRKWRKVTGDDNKARHASLIEGYSKSQDGTLVADDPGAEMLVAAEQDLLDLVEDYTNTIGKTNIQELKQAFEQYTIIVQERNQAIMHYNTCIQLWAKYDEQNQQADALTAKVSKEWVEKSSVNFPAITSFMEQLYLGALTDVMYELYQTQRAYRFVSLDSTDVIASTLGASPLSRLNYSLLLGARASLLKAYRQAHEVMGAPAQHFPARRYKLSNEQLFQVKNFDHPLVTIPVALSTMGEHEHPFHSMANIRLTKARFFATGAKTTSNTLFVRLQHGGDEKIVMTDDTVVSFQHGQIPIDFHYDLGSGLYDGDGLLDGDIGSTASKDYALVGPFASWQIDVTAANNPGLDLKGVTEAFLEFEGQYSAF